jgi:methionine synthase II (cobalamin-independent)
VTAERAAGHYARSVQDGPSNTHFPWSAGSATGIGSMPGTDPARAVAVVLGELPDLPYLPELPGRGPGADLTGRTAALLIDLPVETTPRGWRLADRPGRDQRRAAGMLTADLDALAEAAQGYGGPLKIQVCGPWTLAATLELTRSSEPALADPGAVADLRDSLAEGVAAHAAAVRELVPGATILLQVDEPALPGVLAGSLPTASGLHRLPAVDATTAADGLREILAAAQAPTIVHCCAPSVPFHCITQAGPAAIAFDLSLIRRADLDALGEAAEAGLGIFAGAVPTAPPPTGKAQPGEAAARAAAEAVIGLWRRIGLRTADLPAQVVVTPACGLAGMTGSEATAALARCRQAARWMPELIEEVSG